jgi:hypothetical protein
MEGPGKIQRKEHLWKEAWAMLCWKFRPVGHFQAVWRLLHKRQVWMMVIGMEGEKDYSTWECDNYAADDTAVHACWGCPSIQQIWEPASQ